MNKKLQGLFVVLTFVLNASVAQAAAIDLNEWGVNIDGAISVPTLGDPIPVEVDVSAFDQLGGLGTITVTISGAGSHNVDLFVDHEIDEAINTFFNEYGGISVASPSAGQSWEIDEPGFIVGDIFTNFSNSSLDNTNSVPVGSEDDVSMALGYDFLLGVGDIALVTFQISETMPSSGFYLSQTDPDSNATIYFSGSLEGAVVPEPTTLALMGLGLAGIGYRRYKKAA